MLYKPNSAFFEKGVGKRKKTTMKEDGRFCLHINIFAPLLEKLFVFCEESGAKLQCDFSKVFLLEKRTTRGNPDKKLMRDQKLIFSD